MFSFIHYVCWGYGRGKDTALIYSILLHCLHGLALFIMYAGGMGGAKI